MTETEEQSNNNGALETSIEVNQETGIATAVLTQSAAPTTLSMTLINEMLAQNEVSNWALDESAANDLLIKFKKGKPGRFVLAERKDASYIINLHKDLMSVTIEATPAYGGEALTVEKLTADLTERRVEIKRINKAVLEQLVAITEPASMIVAKGKPPQTGKDSHFQPLIIAQESEDLTLEEDGDSVDHLAGKVYLTIDAGTPLMERIPPEAGQLGIDIHGQIIPAQSGKEIPFASKMEGTEYASNDNNLLVAKISGHPIFLPDGARVDETLKFKNVDLTTGHVEFDGSVHVDGDVMPDMKINVTGDIFVKGAVERATVTAGNNITVGGGVLGDTQVEFTEDELPTFECFLKAGGSIEARYINLASLNAKENIIIKEYAFNSSLHAGADVLLGQSGGKGNLVGGETVAGHAVIGKTLGSKAYVRTPIRVGATRDELVKMNKIKFIREQRLNQARQYR